VCGGRAQPLTSCCTDSARQVHSQHVCTTPAFPSSETCSRTLAGPVSQIAIPPPTHPDSLLLSPAHLLEPLPRRQQTLPRVLPHRIGQVRHLLQHAIAL
jgi:hypothetical protein